MYQSKLEIFEKYFLLFPHASNDDDKPYDCYDNDDDDDYDDEAKL